MGNFSKSFLLLLIVLLAVSSLILVEPAFAQTPTEALTPTPTISPTPMPATPIPSPTPVPTIDISTIQKPSVPEFNLTYIDLSYDVPPTYGIDQFTGKTVIKQEGYHVDNQSIAFQIKNHPFTAYTDSNGHNISLYYNFRFKGHFGSEWSNYPFSDNGQGTHRYSAMFYVLSDQSPKLAASNSEYTDIRLGLPFLFGVQNPPVSSQVDFQVQALVGQITYEGDGYYSYMGQRSDWSNTQTITIGDTAPSQPSPTVPELSLLVAILPLFTLMPALLLYGRHRKTA